MDTDILQIKINEESKNWDGMVNLVDAYLIKTADKRIQKRNNETMQRQEKELKENQHALTPGLDKIRATMMASQEAEEAPIDHTKALRFDHENIKNIADANGMKPKYVYKLDENLDVVKTAELDKILYARRFDVKVFTAEEMEMIACAFKNQLGDVRKGLKDIQILQNKSKFDSKKTIIDQYKSGLKQDLINKGMR